MSTATQIMQVFPNCRDPGLWSSILPRVAAEFEINTRSRLAAFLAQCGHESNQFNTLRENLSYSMLGMMKTWPSRFPTEASTAPFVRQPERLGNYVYADRLGNGDYASGDGWKFRGGGLIQLTGRRNYREAGAALELPLEQQPTKIEDRRIAARVAGWFWYSRGLNQLADEGDFARVTQIVNGGQKGAVERRAYADQLFEVLA